MTKLLAGSGSSVSDDAAEAGRHAATQAVASLHGVPAGLVVVYSRPGYDLPALLAGVRSVTGETPLVGATTCGHFRNGLSFAPDTGVMVLALGAQPYRFSVASLTGIGTDLAAAGQRLAHDLVRAGGGDHGQYGAILLLADGLAGDLQALLSGIFEVTGAAVPVVGGAAADAGRFTGTYVFHDGRVLPNAAVGVWIGSDHPLRVVHQHGWKALGLPLPVTSVDGEVIEEIGGRPALEVFWNNRSGERFGEPAYSYDPLQPYQGSSRALGLIEPDGTQLVRAGLLGPDNKLRTLTPLRRDCVIQVMVADPDALLRAADTVVAGALLGTDDPSVLLVFSCVGRARNLGERAAEEAVRLNTAAAPVETFGCYTYGEFARTTSSAGYHNATIAALAL